MNLKQINNANPLTELSSAVRQRMLEITELEVAGRQAGLAIDTSNQISRALVENSLGLMCIHEIRGDLLYINPAAAQSLGYRNEDGPGRNLRDFLPPAVQHEFAEYLARIKSMAWPVALCVWRQRTALNECCSIAT